MKNSTINLHLPPRRYHSTYPNRTDFILDSARLAAEDTLLDQVIMTASAQAFEQFHARLDRPPKPNERLLKTMITPAPWERG
jgi:uncharacterized protein (DUF1778 family)